MKKNKQFSKHSKTQSTAAARPAAVLCVTGASQVLLDPVFEQLVHAGLVRALPSEGRKGISIERWHEEVLSQLPDDVAVDDDFTPGRFWDQMASDIFMANFQDAVGSSARGIDDASLTEFANATVNAWGWSDANSIELLPYWAGFHPQLRFLLVLTSPEYLLARLIDDGEPETDYLGALRDWHWRTEQVLGFYHRHAARCELVFADQALQNTSALCERLSSKWGCALDASGAQTLEKENTADQTTNPNRADHAESTSDTERLVSVGFAFERDQIVMRVLSLLPEVVSLQRELLATVPSLAESDDEIVTDVVNDVVTDDISDIHDQNLTGDVVQDADHANWQPIALDDDVDLPDALLKQIFTYQHRLGLFFSVQQEKEAAIRQLEVQIKQQQETLSTEQKKLAAETASAKAAKQAHELLEKSHQALEAQMQQSQGRVKEAEEENDLLLAQLHLVQEELERYFLKAQELEQSQETVQVRWQRLASRYPGLCDYKGIEWLEADSDEDRHVWQITDFVDASGREMASLRFEILSQDGFVGFGFRREDGALLYWPKANTAMVESANKKDTNQKNNNQKTNQNDSAIPARLDLVAGRSAQALEKFATGLESLSTADWGFLSTLTELMVEQYEQWAQEQKSDQSDIGSDTQSGAQEDNPIVPWLNGLKQFAQVLESLPTVLRFDGIRVISSVDEGDYAHLALVLNNVSTDSGVHPEFEFRVATVSSGSVFDANPRLEFPRRTGEDVFERWFVESSNAFGENLEIRFAKDGSLVDLPLLLRVAESDKQFMTQLIDRLPGVISTLVAGRVAGAVHNERSADRAADRSAFAQTVSGSFEMSAMSKPAVSVSPSVGHLAGRDVERWLAVTGTMRSIWHRQVPPPMIETAPVKSINPASGKKQGLAGQTMGGSVMGETA